jgi:MFS family permease
MEIKQNPSLRRAENYLQRLQSVWSPIRSRNNYNEFDHPLSHNRTGPEVLVDFDSKNDPYHPLNWSFRKKAITTLLYSLTSMGAGLASSIYAPGAESVAKLFGISHTVSRLGTSLLLWGFATGPLLWAPLSELYGRKPTVLIPYFAAALFAFATGAAANIETVLISRFFIGFFASAPVTNTGGVLADIWSPQSRGVAMVGYALAVLGGPTLGPVLGGLILQAGLSWRWTQYVSGQTLFLNTPQCYLPSD